MPRIARIVAVGLPHHITQRGNYRQNVFLDDDDRRQYLSWIGEYSNKCGLCILVYCLMQNHVYFITVPERKDSFSKTFNTVHMRYSQYFNKKIHATGHLWQGRFNSCVLDEVHLITASRYIEKNPVRAKLVRKSWQWEWSSALAHIDGGESLIKIGDLFKIIDMTSSRWKEYINSEEKEKEIKEIKRHTLTGRPLGNEGFIRKLDSKMRS